MTDALDVALAGSALVGRWTPAQKARLAVQLVEHLVALEVKPSGALWALQASLPDLHRAVGWLERSEMNAKLTPEQLRAACAAEADVEAEETT